MIDGPIILDVLGTRCPIPVKKIRQKLREIPESSILHVLGDDPESLHDIPVLLVRLGLEPAVILEEETGWKFIIHN
jgi:TusA-related sulfurtransferase